MKEKIFERINFPRFFGQLALAVVFASCLTPLDQFANFVGGQIVISGQISPLEETSTVFIGRTAERLPRPISGASVILFDDLNNTQYYFEDPDIAGKYKIENFAGIPGRSYHIRVTFPDGETYESIPETMPVAIGEDEVSHSIQADEYTDEDGIVAERYFLKIFTTHTLAPSPDPVFMKWHVDEVYLLSPTDFPDPFGNIPPPCFISQQVDPQRVILFSNEEIKTSTIPDLQIVSRLVDFSFKERHYFTTYQSSLTREAYQYWRKVDILANQVGSIFDAPPAKVKGNVFNVNDPREEVHGYFQAVNQKFTRFYMLPDDLPYRLTEYCEYRNDRAITTYPSECLNCVSVRNSSLTRPPWF